jgi:hypothetical protein
VVPEINPIFIKAILNRGLERNLNHVFPRDSYWQVSESYAPGFVVCPWELKREDVPFPRALAQSCDETSLKL